MKILYIHGLSSSGSSGTPQRLRKYLPNDTIISPDLPVNPQDALKMLQELAKNFEIDVVVGTSMGGMFAQKLRGYKKIMVNPSFHVSRSMRKILGINDFFSSREDGIKHYEITEELCDLYEQIESTQFENITEDERNISIGLFGTKDDVVNCADEFKQYYHRYSTFDGGHRLSKDNIKHIIVPEIEKMRE